MCFQNTVMGTQRRYTTIFKQEIKREDGWIPKPIYTIPRAKPYQVCSTELGKVVTTWLELGRGGRGRSPAFCTIGHPSLLD